MPQFISKVQHNTYEKGEFSEEKERDLAETIELIKNFPFDVERRLTEIQLTGPSVTVQDEYVNYLKVGLYFNGKLCLYYLDNDNHLYERYVLNVDEACEVVTDHFNGQLDLSRFEKHLFNIGSKKHFEDGVFDYTVNKTTFYVRVIFTFIFLVFFAFMGFGFTYLNGPFTPKLAFLSFCTLFIVLCSYTIVLSIGYFRKAKDMFLHLSAGDDRFQFGKGDNIVEYRKSEIADLTIYGSAGSKGTPVFNLIEITFINGSRIEFPVFLIDQFLLQSKFPNIKITIVTKSSTLRKRRWAFAFR